MRDLYLNVPELTCQPAVFPVDRGGTGAMSVDDAQANLRLIPETALGSADGIAMLDSNGLLPIGVLPPSLFSMVMIDGPDEVVQGTVATYVITNFDARMNYNLLTFDGNLERTGDTITYTVPLTVGSAAFKVNEKTYTIDIVSNRVSQPTLTAPVDNAVDQAVECTLTADTFAVESGSDTHAASTWEVATDSNFDTVLFRNAESTADKTSWAFQGLAYATRYYVRVRYIGTTYGTSPWSETTTFLTKAQSHPQAELSQLQALSGAVNDNFGQSIAISQDGSTALVGAPRVDGVGGTDAGSVTVYTYANAAWTRQTALTATGGATNDYFGTAVALSADGNIALIGATGATHEAALNCGAAYVFVRTLGVWSQQIKLTAFDATAAASFGASVALSADGLVALVGAPLTNTPAGTDAGSAYVYRCNGNVWEDDDQFFADSAAANDRFGQAVALSADGSIALVGAPYHAASAGAAYTFVYTNTVWSPGGAPTSQAPSADSFFGWSVALDAAGTCAVIGAPFEDSAAGANTGSVRLFTATAGVWTEYTQLQASDRAANDQFGASVALDSAGMFVLAGAPYDDHARGINAGAVYGFAKSGAVWEPTQKLTAAAGSTGDLLGVAVAVNGAGTMAVAGAYAAANWTGQAHVFY